MLLVTLHGGQPHTHADRNNVQAYDKEGKLVSAGILEDAPGVTLNELRGIAFFNSSLYVVNANNTQNSLLCYQGTGTSYRFVSRFVSAKTCKSIVHPFDFTFDGKGLCYLSCQDTNMVIRLTVSADGKTGTPAAIPPALKGRGDFLPGTFVASSTPDLCGMPTTAVPRPTGLEYSDDGQKKHSVRGVVWARNALYVVDQPAGRIKVYDGNGNLVGQSNQVETPVHCVVSNGSIYVTGSDAVFTASLPDPAGSFTLAAVPGLRIKNTSGIVFTGQGNVYIASRTENVIFKFDSQFKLLNFRCELPDNPEFLLHI